MFSVVIPLYNKELSLKNTIQSVLNQSFQDFEIVIINDGSTDNSVEVVEAFDDPRIHIIHQKNQGVSAARNKGIEEAKYEWIAFLDADDLWKENHLEQIKLMMQKFPDEKIFATSFEYSHNIKRDETFDKIYLIKDYFKESLEKNILWTGVIVLNKFCLIRVGGFNTSLNRGEDLDLWARLAKKFPIIRSTNITAVYIKDSENKLTASISEYEKSFLSIIDLQGKKGYERKYYKRMLMSRLKNNLKRLSFSEIGKIIWKHKLELLKP